MHAIFQKRPRRVILPAVLTTLLCAGQCFAKVVEGQPKHSQSKAACQPKAARQDKSQRLFPVAVEKGFDMHGAASLNVSVVDDKNSNYRVYLNGINTSGKTIWSTEFPLHTSVSVLNYFAVSSHGSGINLSYEASDDSIHPGSTPPIEEQKFEWDGLHLTFLEDNIEYALPTSELANKGATSLRVRVNPESDSQIYLEGLVGANISWSKAFPLEDDLNFAKFEVSMNKSTITLSSEVANKTLREKLSFSWNGEDLKLISTTFEDPSSDALKLRTRLAVKGTKAEYDSADRAGKLDLLYPWNYFDSQDVASMIGQVHKAALESYNHHQLNQAIQRLSFGLDCAEDLAQLNYDDASESDTRWFSTFSSKNIALEARDYVPAINDYGYFLQQAGRDREAISIFERVVKADPERVVAYLNLADSQWSTGDNENAKKNYAKYLKLAQKQQVKVVSARATDRTRG